ncbi:MAG TPA: NUDIX domain-containing protein [Chloroflexota bacterium]|nr:NUDIX domain-containing protein [Chloroflexota bacterium]
MSATSSAPDDVRFCARCGAAMVTKLVGDKLRRACSVCGFIHFTDPKVGVGVLVLDEAGEILLVRRTMHPEIGRWSLPAGYLDQGEDPQVTAVREVWEETGLHVTIDGLLDVYHNPPQQGGASIFILYRGRVIGGELKAGDDADAAAFFSLNALPDVAFASTQAAIAALRNP